MWILDIMLTGEISGYDLIKALKEKHSSAAVIFTSARDQDLDKIMGLELGSDDYLAKPYSPRELILRVKAVLKRRAHRQGKVSSGPQGVLHQLYGKTETGKRGFTAKAEKGDGAAECGKRKAREASLPTQSPFSL